MRVNKLSLVGMVIAIFFVFAFTPVTYEAIASGSEKAGASSAQDRRSARRAEKRAAKREARRVEKRKKKKKKAQQAAAQQGQPGGIATENTQDSVRTKAAATQKEEE